LGLRVGTMINGKLQDFAAGATARGQISFGDVRRLQRDCLPLGITTRDEAECLVALDATLVRADRAWAAWLVPALAEFVTAQQAAGVAGEGGTKAWLQGLLVQSPSAAALSRKVARHIRRSRVAPPADEATEAQPRVQRKVRTCKAGRAPRKSARTVRSDIVMQRSRRAVARTKRTASGATIMPCEVWSAGLMEKHWRFQLARPAA
jgi:hypothetical protein